MIAYTSTEELVKKYFKKSSNEVIEARNFDEQEKMILENFECEVKHIMTNSALRDMNECRS